jgi:hypothetical protein
MGSLVLLKLIGLLDLNEAQGIDHWFLLELMGSMALQKLFGSLVLTEAFWIIGTY